MCPQIKYSIIINHLLSVFNCYYSEINKSVESVHECPICHRQYNKKSILRTHMVIHGEKKFLCSYCGKGFFSIASLQAHSKVGNRACIGAKEICGFCLIFLGSHGSSSIYLPSVWQIF